jgi:hypothetical protein
MPTDANRLVDDLGKALEDTLRLRRAADIKAFCSPSDLGPRFLERPRLRIAEHFDIEPAFLILDPGLGTLGIVELVLPDASDPDGVRKTVCRHVDTAIYARHLLLRAQTGSERTALAVELVLVTDDEVGADPATRTVAKISQALRTLLDGGDVLSHIGIGLLCHAGNGGAYDGRLRRAFPWLLGATHRWAKSSRSRPPADDGAKLDSGRLERVVMTDYRLRGTRTLSFGTARVHLAHGPNGSGKSSLVEALELVTTGKIDRLERAKETDYDRVIRNRDVATPARIELMRGRDRAVTVSRAVTAAGIEQPIDAGVDASSFRLDQALMDRLSGLFPHERAQAFLRAFFPEAAPSLGRYEKATADRTRAVDASKPLVTRFEQAREALGRLKDFRWTESTATSEEFPALLNAWLEKTALADLAQRERAVRTTLANARADGWQPRDGRTDRMLDAIGRTVADLGALQRHEVDCIDDVNALYKQLASFSSARRAEQQRERTTAVLAAEDVDTLNQVSRWLFPDGDLQVHGLLGDKIARVMHAGDAPSYGTITIGSEDWTAPLVNDLSALIQAWSGLTGDKDPVVWPGKAICTDYEDASAAQTSLVAAAKELTEGFLSKLQAEQGQTGEFDGSLIAAVNELMALFTPARWSYEDVLLPPTLDKGTLEMSLELGSGTSASRADLQLNTAELNLFTVSLFLLCAARVRKPLGLLLLDDPLQNMDELTSTALARGLAKLVRLWTTLERSEELLLLFHGYDDLDRFRAEVDAAVYKLPWLAPSAEPNPVDVVAEGTSGVTRPIQTLEGLVVAR